MLDLHRTLQALHALVGKRVEVTARGAGGTPPMALEVSGVLAGLSELSPRGPELDDALLFTVLGRDGATIGSFALSEDSFRGARWGGVDRDVLELRLGEVALLVAEYEPGHHGY